MAEQIQTISKTLYTSHYTQFQIDLKKILEFRSLSVVYQDIEGIIKSHHQRLAMKEKKKLVS